MTVYFIRAGQDGPVKIGKASDPERRRTDLQMAHYQDLTIIRTVDGDEPVERWLHRHYASKHVRGEWFHFCPSMMVIQPPLLVSEESPRRDEDTPLNRAIEACGGVAALARMFGISSQAVSQWNRVPPERALEVSKASGVPLHELRPDIYPAPVDEPQRVAS